MENLIPVKFQGTIADVNLDEFETYMTADELSYITERFDVDPSAANIFEKVTAVEDQVAILFAMKKNDDAWRLIEANKDTIHYEDVMQTPYFSLPDIPNFDLFKTFYGNKKIDDDSYMYLNVVYGKIFDMDFFTESVKHCLSAKEILEKIYKAYNGINPIDCPAIEYTREIRDMLEFAMIENEDLTEYIVGSKASLKFEPGNYVKFIKNGCIAKTSLMSVIEILALEGKTDDDLVYVFNAIYDNIGDNEIVCNMEDSIKAYVGMICSRKMFDKETLGRFFLSSVVNSPVFILHPRRTINYILDCVKEFGAETDKFDSYIDLIQNEDVAYCIRDLRYIGHYKAFNKNISFESSSPMRVMIGIFDPEYRCFYLASAKEVTPMICDLEGFEQRISFLTDPNDPVYQELEKNVEIAEIEETYLELLNFKNEIYEKYFKE